ncbi:zinc finger protein 570-like isoform X1 [Ambystoma mexicanum]|uniref:zinc finger protein 570-like isoform X1 n=1 Tax=Ambystoma mexicanum TaxID=8296 RepID=UPI0037E74098
MAHPCWEIHPGSQGRNPSQIPGEIYPRSLGRNPSQVTGEKSILDRWGEMPGQGPDETYLTFLDAPACFSEKEWMLLKEWQKELYRNVMNEIHQALLSLGPLIVTTVFSLRTKEKQDLCPSDSREKAANIHGDGISVQEALLGINRKERLNLKGPLKTEGRECLSTDSIFIDNVGKEAETRNVDPESGYGMISCCFKEDEASCCSDDLDSESERSPRMPTEYETISFTIKEDEATYCSGNQDSEGQQSLPLSTGFCIQACEATYSTDAQDARRKRRSSTPTKNPVITTNATLCMEDKADAYWMEHHQSEIGDSTRSLAEDGAVALQLNSTRCTYCDRSFTEHSRLLAHMTIHTKDKGLICSMCGTSCADRPSLIIHKHAHMSKESYGCTESGKTFTNSSNLHPHRKTHMREQPYQHMECEKTLTWRSFLHRHQKSPAGERPHQCPECGKSFTQRSNLYSHQKIHTGVRPYQCSECEKSFSQSANLAKHQRIHTGEKPYQCPVCKKSFSDPSSRSRHQRTHTGEKPYGCTVCGKHFTQRSNLRQHHRSHIRERLYLL